MEGAGQSGKASAVRSVVAIALHKHMCISDTRVRPRWFLCYLRHAPDIIYRRESVRLAIVRRIDCTPGDRVSTRTYRGNMLPTEEDLGFQRLGASNGRCDPPQSETGHDASHPLIVIVRECAPAISR